MPVDRSYQLEQALLAVIASAKKLGISSDVLCAEAVGGLMADRFWQWADAEHKDGAADEIETALTLLFEGRNQAQQPKKAIHNARRT